MELDAIINSEGQVGSGHGLEGNLIVPQNAFPASNY